MGAQDTYPLSETVMDMARVLGGLSRRVTTETDERNALQRCLERVCVSLDVEGAFIGLLAASDRVAIAHEHRTDRRLPSLLGSQIGLQSGMREASDLPTRCCASDAGEVACWGAVAPRTTGSCLHVVLGYAGRPFGVLAVQGRPWKPSPATWLPCKIWSE